ncbi:ferredoxin family protein [Mesobacillus zeae]|uniref:4Fe-4S dicluster domain-containing protein n=1 Tax=Mesobacillus zeae TaxID=1917180 RepID=UPI001FE61A0A|nr:4Fe-4S binding protein [Mesobacillus zeae]
MEQRVLFTESLCKSCGLCVSVCPANVIFLSDYLNEKGYRPASAKNQESCISCGKCARICPDSAISVYRSEKIKHSV